MARIPHSINRWTRPGSHSHTPSDSDNEQRAGEQAERAKGNRDSGTSYMTSVSETKWVEDVDQAQKPASMADSRVSDRNGTGPRPTDAVEASRTYAYSGGIPVVEPDRITTPATFGSADDAAGGSVSPTSARVQKTESTADVKAQGGMNGYMSPNGWVAGDPPSEDDEDEEVDADADANADTAGEKPQGGGGGGLIAVESTSSSASTLLGTPTQVESKEEAVETGSTGRKPEYSGVQSQGDQGQGEGASSSETAAPTPSPTPSTSALADQTASAATDGVQPDVSATPSYSSTSIDASGEVSSSGSTDSASSTMGDSASGGTASGIDSSATSFASSTFSAPTASATFYWSGPIPTTTTTPEGDQPPGSTAASSTIASSEPSPSSTSQSPQATENVIIDAQDTFLAASSSTSYSEKTPINSGSAQGANKEDGESSRPSKGTTAGAVIGGLIAVLILGTLAICLLKARRRNSDRRRMARSSWFYGGDVALPEDQTDREKSWLQSRFSAPSINGTYGHRISSVVAKFNPLNLARPHSSRYPSSATPGYASAERVETMSEAPPLPPIQSQGGWADRFFAQPDVQDGTGTPAPMVQAFPTPMIRNASDPSQPLHVVNRLSSGSGSTRQLAPFVRVDSASDRSSMTSSTDSTASVAHAASVDLSKTAAKNAVLQQLAQRPPSGLQYGSSYATPLQPPSVPLPQPPSHHQAYRVPAPMTAKTNAESHWSSPFEYDRSIQRQSVADTSSVYSRNSAAGQYDPRSLVQRGNTIGKVVARETMETTSSMYGVGAYHPREGADARGQQERMVGDGMPRAL